MVGISNWVLQSCRSGDIEFFENHVITWSTSCVKRVGLRSFHYNSQSYQVWWSFWKCRCSFLQISWNHIIYESCYSMISVKSALVRTLLKLMAILLVEVKIDLFFEYYIILLLITRLIVTNIALLTVLFCNCLLFCIYPLDDL